jgi:hypothetical protein
MEFHNYCYKYVEKKKNTDEIFQPFMLIFHLLLLFPGDNEECQHDANAMFFLSIRSSL